MKTPSRGAVAVGLFAMFHLLILIGEFIAPYNYSRQHREFPFAPPSKIHFVDKNGDWHVRPWVYELVSDEQQPLGYREDLSEKFQLRFLVKGDPYDFLGLWTLDTHLIGVEQSKNLFLAGTDALGRDVFSRILVGGQLSVLAGLLATALAIGIGVFVGLVAGFYGGWRDHLLMRGTELFLALPWLYLLLGIRAFLPLRMPTTKAFLIVILVIGLVGWSRPARLVRNLVASLRQQDFFAAARSAGSSNARLVRREILPHISSAVLTHGALLIPQYIMAEVTLSFLGLGVGEPHPSWGNLLADLQNYYVLSTYWWMLLPALPLIIVSMGYFSLASWIKANGKLQT